MYEDDDIGAFFCRSCNTDLYHAIDRSMMTYCDRSDDSSNGCNHRICSVCYTKTFARRTTATCPLCRVIVNQINYSESDTDRQWCENEHAIRKRVITVYSKIRKEFDNTPLYDIYVEEREEKIASMIRAPPEVRRKLDQELRQYENDHHTDLTNSSLLSEEEKKKRILDIVKREGIFYEIVKQQPWMSQTKLVHPFRLKYLNYFDDPLDPNQQPSFASQLHNSAVLPKPLNEFPARPQPVEGDVGSQEWRKNGFLRTLGGGYSEAAANSRAEAELFRGFASIF